MELFTIGHSTIDIEEFLNLLQQYEIDALTDIRSIPYSRSVPQYSKDTFTETLNRFDISYTYAGDRLGGFPKDPQVYRSGRVPQTWAGVSREVDYQAIMKKAWYLEGIDALVKRLGSERTVILCAEEDPADCHRQHLVAQSLLGMGVKVTHIRRNGMCQPAWLDTMCDCEQDGEINTDN